MSTQEIDLSLARNRFRAFNNSAQAGAPVIEQPPKLAYSKPHSDFKCYGGARETWQAVLSGEPQVVIHGPAETGKSMGCLHLIDYLCWEYPKVQGVITRKVRADMPGSILQTFENKVIKMENGATANGITKYGGENPEFYQYPNGSRIWIAGMDRPGRVLSAEKDFIYFNQAEEAELNDWETCSTRTTGRAGVLKPGRLIGDANPGPSTHWIMALDESGAIKLIKSYHQDNPSLFDPDTGEPTAQGKRTIENLKKLTGVRYKRLYLGLWVAAEGVVYEFWDPTTHANKTKTVGEIIYYFASVDWGLKNPGVIQVWGVDGDARMYRYEEVYRTGKLVAASKPEDAWWVNKAIELQNKYNIRTFVPDPSRPDHITVFEEAGLDVTPAYNDVELGIQNVESRLKIQPDGFPRLMLMAGSKDHVKDENLTEKHLPTCLEEEIEVYAYPKDTKASVNKVNKKENPVEKDNHACDAMRYAAAYVDGLGENEFMFGRG